jgi:hypothetical protein
MGVMAALYGMATLWKFANVRHQGSHEELMVQEDMGTMVVLYYMAMLLKLENVKH